MSAGIGSALVVGSCHDHLNVASGDGPEVRLSVKVKYRWASDLGPVSACLARRYHSSAVPGALGGARTFTAVKNTSSSVHASPGVGPGLPASPATRRSKSRVDGRQLTLTSSPSSGSCPSPSGSMPSPFPMRSTIVSSSCSAGSVAMVALPLNCRGRRGAKVEKVFVPNLGVPKIYI